MVDGVRLTLHREGQGPPVILLRGNVVTAEDLFETSRLLDLLAKRHRVTGSTARVLDMVTGHMVRLECTRAGRPIRDALVILGVHHPVVLGVPGVQRWRWHWR